MTSFLSQNVRGLGNKEKRLKLFQWLKSQEQSFYFLQETHVNSKCKSVWEAEWDYLGFFSGNSSNSEGLAILVNKKIPKNKIICHTEILPGRLQALEVIIENKPILLVNIYGPNKDNTLIFEN